MIAAMGFDFVAREWKSPITAPSNSTLSPVLTVMGEKALQRMFSQTLVAIKSEIPDPSPYPFWRSSSRRRTMNPAHTNYEMMITQLTNPISETLPYIPDMT